MWPFINWSECGRNLDPPADPTEDKPPPPPYATQALDEFPDESPLLRCAVCSEPAQMKPVRIRADDTPVDPPVVECKYCLTQLTNQQVVQGLCDRCGCIISTPY